MFLIPIMDERHRGHRLTTQKAGARCCDVCRPHLLGLLWPLAPCRRPRLRMQKTTFANPNMLVSWHAQLMWASHEFLGSPRLGFLTVSQTPYTARWCLAKWCNLRHTKVCSQSKMDGFPCRNSSKNGRPCLFLFKGMVVFGTGCAWGSFFRACLQG